MVSGHSQAVHALPTSPPMKNSSSSYCALLLGLDSVGGLIEAGVRMDGSEDYKRTLVKGCSEPKLIRHPPRTTIKTLPTKFR